MSFIQFKHMQWEVTVRYNGANANYKIATEARGIYQAYLLHYEGNSDFDPPPETLTFFRGIRKWIGSTNQPELLTELGRSIEHAYSSKDYLHPDDYYKLRDNPGDGISPDAFPIR